MRDFDEIIAVAAKRKGGRDQLEKLLAETPSRQPSAIAAIPDDRILAAMTRRVFYAGFSSKVIDAKWDAFEAAFERFDPHACAFMSEDHFDALMKDSGIVRNEAKIRSVQANAKLLLDLASEHGSAARFFAAWPDPDYVGLLDILKTRGSRLGGDSGMRFLRAIGKPAFIASPDVVAALIREGVLTRPPGGKRDLLVIQNAFNQWSKSSGRNLTDVSRILAMSVESNADVKGRARPARRSNR
jgi:3-methyladenine DNA glycosylase Tag